MKKYNYYLLISVFSFYLLILIWVISFKCGIIQEILGTGYTLNPISFGPETSKYMELNLLDRFIYDFTIRHDDPLTLLKDLSLNVGVFIPFGLSFSLIIKKEKGLNYTLLSAFLISLSFELIQLFTAFGSFSFFDLFTNTLGAILGYLLYMYLIKVIKKENLDKILTISLITLLIILIGLFIFAIYNVSINIDVIIYRYTYIFNK